MAAGVSGILPAPASGPHTGMIAAVIRIPCKCLLRENLEDVLHSRLLSLMIRIGLRQVQKERLLRCS